MTISDGLMILAVLAGPLLAVQATRYLDNKKEIRERKLAIFKTLMATRAESISRNHVESLNRIDLEFDSSSQKDKEVVVAWKAYLDVLGDISLSSEQWDLKRVESMIELLYRMGVALNYDFDKTHIKNSIYSPVAHGRIERENEAIRAGVIEILAGKQSLPVSVKDET